MTRSSLMFFSPLAKYPRSKAVIAGVLCLLWRLLIPDAIIGQDARARIERGKAATAFISRGSGAFGASATCISPTGLFITTGSAVHGDSVTLLLSPGDDKERKVTAKVIRRDPLRDIAILQATEGADFVSLEVGDDATLRETDTVTIFGYPFGDKAEPDEKFGPQISVNVCRISALRKKSAELDEIQVDAEINPGNQGGPALDSQGKVIGLVHSGLFATGVNFLLPSSRIHASLAKPVARLELPTIQKGSLLREQIAILKLNSAGGPYSDAEVELVLTQFTGKSRAFAGLQTAPGVYQFRFSAQAEAPTFSMPWIWSKIDFPGGSVTGQLSNQQISIHGETFGLEQIRSIEMNGAAATAQLHDGRELAGALGNWPSCTLDLGGAQWTVATNKITRVEFRPVRFPAISPVHYCVTLRQKSESIPLLDGELLIEGAPRSYDSINWKHYEGKQQKEIKTPGSIVDAILAGGGEFLLLQTSDGGISFYDVNKAELAETLKLPAADAHIAASLDHLFVAIPSKNLLQRWSLKTKKLEVSCNLPIPAAQFAGMAIGYASRGPLMMSGVDGQTQSARRRFVPLDPMSLARLDIDLSSIESRGDRFLTGNWHLRASATGGTFSLFPHYGNLENSVVSLRIERNRIELSESENPSRLALPSYDGSTLFTDIGVMDWSLRPKPMSTAIKRMIMPTTHQGLNLAFTREIVLTRASDGAPLATIPFSREVLEAGFFKGSALYALEAAELTMEKRYLFIPQARQFITIPDSNDRIWIDASDPAPAIAGATANAHGSTANMGIAWRGARYLRALGYELRSGKLELRLIKGPSGLRVTPAGEIDWQTPSDFPDRFADLTMSVKAPDGAEVMETLRIPVVGGGTQ